MEESELARQFRVHRQGGGIGPLLEAELSTLECLVLDGTCGEEMHALYAPSADRPHLQATGTKPAHIGCIRTWPSTTLSAICV